MHEATPPPPVFGPTDGAPDGCADGATDGATVGFDDGTTATGPGDLGPPPVPSATANTRAPAAATAPPIARVRGDHLVAVLVRSSAMICSWILAETRARLADGTSSARIGSAARSRSSGSGPFGSLIRPLLRMRHPVCPSLLQVSGSGPDVSGRRPFRSRGRPRSAPGLDA